MFAKQESGADMAHSGLDTWETFADRFAQEVDRPLMTLLGATHTLVSGTDGPDARALAESAARNAAAVAQLVVDLQNSIRRQEGPARREMIEVVSAARAALSGCNVRIEGDESIVALADSETFSSFLTRLVASSGGRTVTITIRREPGGVRIAIRPSFPEHPFDPAFARALAGSLGPVSGGADGSVALTLAGFAIEDSPFASRWPREPVSDPSTR